MENDVINSCLMWAAKLDTPVDLGAIFDSEDLKDTGIELDSHVTLLYAQDKVLPNEEILKDIEGLLGSDYVDFLNLCKSGNDCSVFDMFDLYSFSNDSDYIVLKLKKDNKIFNIVNLINRGLRIKYDINSELNSYTPHITLAELEKGKAEKYIKSEKLQLVLEDSYIDFEDLIMSCGRKQIYLTNFNSVDRYFRLQDLQKFNNELK